jgi:hypothetical protein
LTASLLKPPLGNKKIRKIPRSFILTQNRTGIWGKVRFKQELNAAERRYKAERGRLEARLEKEVQKSAETAAYMKRVQVPPDISPVFWTVAQGKDLNSRGVYPSWEVCRQHIHGISNSVFDEFKTEHEA